MTSARREPTDSAVQTVPKPASEIAEGILGHIDWITTTEGYCECPGASAHTTKEGKRDCILYMDHVPTIHCVHASCSEAVGETNRRLRAAVLSGCDNGEPRKLTAEDRERLKEREKRNRIRQRAAKSLNQILGNYGWPYASIIQDSPVKIPSNDADHWRLLLAKFDSGDIVWIGNTYDSGKPEHAARFKAVKEWLSQRSALGPFICPATFKNTSIARSNENILVRRFLVIESDTLKKDQVGAIFRWLKDACGLQLVAIVDTAGKSLHGWFQYPQPNVIEELKLVLPALQCDPKLFTASQPVRLPGALRDGKYQKLIYLSQEVGDE